MDKQWYWTGFPNINRSAPEIRKPRGSFLVGIRPRLRLLGLQIGKDVQIKANHVHFGKIFIRGRMHTRHA